MFKEKIKEELKKRGWSIKELSLQTGIRYPSLTEYLRGNKELNSNNLEKIFFVLNILKTKTKI